MVIFVNVQVVTKTMPENNIHRGDDELGGVQNHSHYHNVNFLFYSYLRFSLCMSDVILVMQLCGGSLFVLLSSFQSGIVYLYIDIE